MNFKKKVYHMLILLWLDGSNKLHNVIDIDKIISAELPHSEIVQSCYKLHHIWTMWSG